MSLRLKLNIETTCRDSIPPRTWGRFGFLRRDAICANETMKEFVVQRTGLSQRQPGVCMKNDLLRPLAAALLGGFLACPLAAFAGPTVTPMADGSTASATALVNFLLA